ncbi:MAG: hypothetical protein M9892_07440 [Bacteroidetes bacterium]|nr:hypothetical protein [Bacteroidota bacterium]
MKIQLLVLVILVTQTIGIKANSESYNLWTIHHYDSISYDYQGVAKSELDNKLLKDKNSLNIKILYIPNNDKKPISNQKFNPTVLYDKIKYYIAGNVGIVHYGNLVDSTEEARKKDILYMAKELSINFADCGARNFNALIFSFGQICDCNHNEELPDGKWLLVLNRYGDTVNLGTKSLINGKLNGFLIERTIENKIVRIVKFRLGRIIDTSYYYGYQRDSGTDFFLELNENAALATFKIISVFDSSTDNNNIPNEVIYFNQNNQLIGYYNKGLNEEVYYFYYPSGLVRNMYFVCKDTHNYCGYSYEYNSEGLLCSKTLFENGIIVEVEEFNRCD